MDKLVTINSRITGPTPLPESVIARMGQQMLSHRSDDFKAVFSRVNKQLQGLLGCAMPLLTFTSSGTAGLEASITNVLTPQDRVLVLSIGHYGDLYASMARHYLPDRVDVLRLAPGQGMTAEMVEQALKLQQYDAVLLTHNESSTGCLQPLESICRAIKKHSGALIMVDAISSVGTTEVQMDLWQIDVLICVPQKGLMAPPGMSIIGCSEKAMVRAASGRTFGSVAFDFTACLRQAEKFQTLTTPSLHAFWGLDESLDMIVQETPAQVFLRHQRVAAMMRARMTELGLSLLPQPLFYSPGITAVLLPPGVDSAIVMSRLESDHQITIGQGVGALQSTVLRIAHMGHFDDKAVADTADALAEVLAFEKERVLCL
jgi:aspartate aminotransferase-like enzyme